MNKAELISAIAKESGLSKADAAKAVDAFVLTVTDALRDGERISLIGFGTWSVNERPARAGRNPSTGEAIQIEAKTVVRFKPGASLSRAVN